LGAWAVYWIGLVLVSLGPGLFAAARVLGAPKGHGKIDVSMSDGTFTANVVGDALHWTGSASLMSIVLWLAGPPLLLWLLWLVTRRAPAGARDAERDYRVN
jgi:hypothetical protein